MPKSAAPMMMLVAENCSFCEKARGNMNHVMVSKCRYAQMKGKLILTKGDQNVGATARRKHRMSCRLMTRKVTAPQPS